ncbi:MAG: MBL fold metallo-hydrolase [Clostridia bacterium]|nr:MBL fold metallo-hydrolase [Clostridia bacterium]
MRMKVKYYGHSGFSVELENHWLLFDYYTGAAPVLPENKAVCVFVSHHHPDHLNPEIFTWQKHHPDIRYILASDIRKDYPEQYGAVNCHFVRGEMTEEYDDIQVQTLRSTDCGVAFLVTVEGKRIYHAGDLCLWLWEGMDRNESRQMMGTFMKYVSPLKNIPIDLAFLTLDNRQEKGAYLNMDYYMRHFMIEACVPMHYFGDTAIADRLKADSSSEPYRDRIFKMNPGDTLDV